MTTYPRRQQSLKISFKISQVLKDRVSFVSVSKEFIVTPFTGEEASNMATMVFVLLLCVFMLWCVYRYVQILQKTSVKHVLQLLVKIWHKLESLF